MDTSQPTRLLVTGSRNWTNQPAMLNALRTAWHHLHDRGFSDIILIHGGARGADHLAGRIWEHAGLPVEVHPADWDTHGKKAGFLRNKHMVELGADLCLAFPLGGITRHPRMYEIS